MREPYIEGVATHDDPEPCACIREDVGEAWDRGTYGPGIEPRNAFFQGADAVKRGGRQHDRHRQRKMPISPARSETPRMYGTSLRENREVSRPSVAMVRRAASGRP